LAAFNDDIAAWVNKHGPQLVLFARQWVQDRWNAEDVVQEAFVRFWPRKDSAQQPLAYLYQCVRNTAQNWNRSQERRRRHQTQFEPVAWFWSDEAKLETKELGELVEGALKSLPIEQREVVVMHVWGDLTFREIAAALDAPLPTIQSRYRYALQKLRPQLEAIHDE